MGKKVGRKKAGESADVAPRWPNSRGGLQKGGGKGSKGKKKEGGATACSEKKKGGQRAAKGSREPGFSLACWNLKPEPAHKKKASGTFGSGQGKKKKPRDMGKAKKYTWHWTRVSKSGGEGLKKKFSENRQ